MRDACKCFAWVGVLVMLGVPMLAQTHAAAVIKDVAPTGPTVVIDTSMGRMVCRLYEKEAPVTVANFIGLADGSKDWKDPATDKIVHGTPFYDGTGLVGVIDGVLGGDRLGMLRGTAGPPFAAEKSGLGFDRPGRMVMAHYTPEPGSPKGPSMTSSSVFYVLEHADKEAGQRGGTVFGQCDEASVQVATAISHVLLNVDNHPAQPVAINHIAVVKEGEALPPVAAAVPLASVVPQPAPMPTAVVPAPEPTGPTAVIDTSAGRLRANCSARKRRLGWQTLSGWWMGRRSGPALRRTKRYMASGSMTGSASGG